MGTLTLAPYRSIGASKLLTCPHLTFTLLEQNVQNHDRPFSALRVSGQCPCQIATTVLLGTEGSVSHRVAVGRRISS